MSDRKQTMTMNAEGELLTSCDSIFPSIALTSNNLRNQFPFLDSVYDELLENLEVGQVVNFPKVETKHPFLSGYYDYSFRLIRIHKNQRGIQWEVIDATEEYNVLKEKQQSDHEGDMENDNNTFQ